MQWGDGTELWFRYFDRWPLPREGWKLEDARGEVYAEFRQGFRGFVGFRGIVRTVTTPDREYRVRGRRRQGPLEMTEPSRGDEIVAVWNAPQLTLVNGPTVRFEILDFDHKKGASWVGLTEDGRTVMTLSHQKWARRKEDRFDDRIVLGGVALGDKTIPAIAFACHAFVNPPDG